MNRPEIEALFGTAIGREVEAKEFYASVAAGATDKVVKETFEQLANEENGHRELLERFRVDPTLPMKIPAPPQDFKIAEATEMPRLSAQMSPPDAIALAMKKEEQAVGFYRTMAAASSDAELKGIFENLANMELGHKHRLENIFVDIGYPESF